MSKSRKYDLEERLITFSVEVINMINDVKKTKAGNQLCNQLVRSGTSVSLNYGEAQAAESRRDFIHKMKVILKELRESLVCLQLIQRCYLHKSINLVSSIADENKELVLIIAKSIRTAQQSMTKQPL